MSLIMNSQTNENLYECKNNDYECYRTNHFEVEFYSYDENGKEELVDGLRQSTYKATFYKTAGKMSIYVYAIPLALDYLNTLNEGHKFRIKYVLYKQDGSGNFVLADDIMKLTEISCESLCYDSNNNLDIRLDFNRCTNSKVISE